MAWINTDFRFKRRGALFAVPRRAGGDFQYLLDLAERCQGSTAMRDAITEFVEKSQPALAGCEIWFMEFSPWKFEWVIGVAHRSLPEVAEGECYPRMELSPPPAA